MNTKPFLCAVAAALFALPAVAALSANPEPQDLDPEMLAEIAKARARANSLQRAGSKSERGGGRATDPTAECGAVSIGNVVGNRRVGFAPIDINVIVLGDILNVNNNCKKP
jgi:hypothetical protein